MSFIGSVPWAVRNDSNRGTDAGQTKKAAPAAKKIDLTFVNHLLVIAFIFMIR